jgi:hypothetical protein
MFINNRDWREDGEKKSKTTPYVSELIRVHRHRRREKKTREKTVENRSIGFGNLLFAN